MQDILARARTELRYEPIERRVRATLGHDTVVDSTNAVLLWEPRRVVPSYAVPRDDIAADVTRATATDNDGDAPRVLHPGIPFALHTAPGEPLTIAGREAAGFRLDDDDLAGYVALDFGAFDAWLEEDDPVAGHPRDPFHRVDVRRTARPVRIELDGEPLAETTAARMLFETSLPTRFYVPRDDVGAELQATATRSYCPYKGHASYWSAEIGGRRRDDLAWSYEQPHPTRSRSPAWSPSGTSRSTSSSTTTSAPGRAARSPTRCATSSGSARDPTRKRGRPPQGGRRVASENAGSNRATRSIRAPTAAPWQGHRPPLTAIEAARRNLDAQPPLQTAAAAPEGAAAVSAWVRREAPPSRARRG